MKNKWKTKEAINIIKKAGLKAMRTGMESILTEAIKQTPVDTGTLRRSGTVTAGALPDTVVVYEAAKSGTDMSGAFPNEEGKESAIYVSFNTPYARVMHEEIGYNHPKGGKAKYLEDAFNENIKKVKTYVDKKIKKALKDAE